MRVAHVMTYAHGGAGTAAMRIHRALKAVGACESTIVCLSAPSGGNHDDIEALPVRLPRFWERASNRIGVPLARTDRLTSRRAKLELEDIPFSDHESDYDILAHPSVKSADVINLHWVGDLLDWRSFFGRVNKPVVWTLHDMNPFLGGFHYLGDARRASPAARVFDAKLIAEKRDLTARATMLHIVAPSGWIRDHSASSEILGRFPHTTIPYPTDPEVFRAHACDAARDVLGIPLEARVLLTVSERASDHRKGADILRAALCDASVAGRYYWAAVGTPSGLAGSGAHALGTISDPRLMSLAYSAADLVVVPSREDNLPNVVIESLTCGTPVVALPTGGLPEMIDDSINGALAANASSAGLAEAISRAERLHFDRQSIRRNALDTYDPAKVATQYLAVYRAFTA